MVGYQINYERGRNFVLDDLSSASAQKNNAKVSQVSFFYRMENNHASHCIIKAIGDLAQSIFCYGGIVTIPQLNLSDPTELINIK